MTKTRPFLSMCYGDPSATEVPPCCETATKKLTFSTTSVLLLLNMPLSLSRATIFRRQKNPRRVYRPKIAGILFVCNEPEGKYYTVPTTMTGRLPWSPRRMAMCLMIRTVLTKGTARTKSNDAAMIDAASSLETIVEMPCVKQAASVRQTTMLEFFKCRLTWCITQPVLHTAYSTVYVCV